MSSVEEAQKFWSFKIAGFKCRFVDQCSRSFDFLDKFTLWSKVTLPTRHCFSFFDYEGGIVSHSTLFGRAMWVVNRKGCLQLRKRRVRVSKLVRLVRLEGMPKEGAVCLVRTALYDRSRKTGRQIVGLSFFLSFYYISFLFSNVWLYTCGSNFIF